MDNAQIASVFNNIGDLLELKGEVVFKTRAYKKAARAIEHHPTELSQIFREEGEEGLTKVPSVGQAINKKVQELLSTGQLEYYEKLKGEFPEGVVELKDVPGVGPKTALKISRDLGVTNLEGLEAALKEGAVAALPGLGEKAAANILRHLQTLRTKDRRIPLGRALSMFADVASALRGVPGLHRLEAAGSLRRRRETIGDIDMMGTADDPEPVLRALTELPQVAEVLGSRAEEGKRAASAWYTGGPAYSRGAGLRIVDPVFHGEPAAQRIAEGTGPSGWVEHQRIRDHESRDWGSGGIR